MRMAFSMFYARDIIGSDGPCAVTHLESSHFIDRFGMRSSRAAWAHQHCRKRWIVRRAAPSPPS